MTLITVSLPAATLKAQAIEDIIWLEAECFEDTGSWSNDSQHVDLMGSPYLLATGVGRPVKDAITTASVSASGNYRLWVRCRDWLPEYHPGLFQVCINGDLSDTTFGKANIDAWQWIDGGTFNLKKGEIEVRLHDLNGWWGRCDAVVLAAGGFRPANDPAKLAQQRLNYGGVSSGIGITGDYDVVVVGGGPSGIGAAVSAARHGSKVALIQDRPVLGGNASSEIQVPPMGYIGNPQDRVNITGLAEEFFPKQGWQNFADSKKIESIVRAEKNISLFLNTRATGVVMEKSDKIKSVLTLAVKTGHRISFTAPVFIDCTGHGWIGYYAGAEYRMGQEARSEFGESLAPLKAGKRTMGNGLNYAVIKTHDPEDVIKYSDKEKVTITGQWILSTFNGGDYLHDGNTGKGSKSISFKVNVNSDAEYRVFLGYLAYGNRAKNVPVTITHARGRSKLFVDQTSNVNGLKELGTFRFESHKPGYVKISNDRTTNYVIADFIRISPEDNNRNQQKPNVAFQCPPWAYKWTKDEDFEPLNSHRRLKDIVRPENFDRPSRGKGRNPGNNINGGISHAWWVEYGGMLNIIEDAEKIRDELFRINIGLWNYAKNHNPQTIERNRSRELVWLNYVPGVRESRRLVGDYIMSQKDYDNRIIHKDTIGFTDWGPDVHHPEGFWVKGNDCIHVYQGKRTSIPYRTLYSKNITNLFMAGRCHSASHIALGGTRVMRPMMQTGQAAGTAAGLVVKYNTTPRGIYHHHITEFQQELLKDGCYLLGVKNNDKNDIALTAKVTASSHLKDMNPGKVTNGFNRIIGKDRNAWAPNLNTPGPHWLKLALPKITPINTIHLTSEERCADFRIEAFIKENWIQIAEVKDNRNRRVVLHFEPVNTDRIRLVVTAAHNPCILCEVRLYNEAK
jgi:hypothetical protein